MEWVRVRGFRSVEDAHLDSGNRVNCLMGLNDHGKSNILRAIHLFFTGQPEPDLPFVFDRDVKRDLSGVRRRVVVDIGLDPDTSGLDRVLQTAKRNRVASTEQVALRRVWRSRLEVQTALMIGKPDGWKVYRRKTDDPAVVGQAETDKVLHAPQAFEQAVTKVLERVRIRYLPFSAEAGAYFRMGLAAEVRSFLVNPYGKGPRSAAKGLADGVDAIPPLWDKAVNSHFGPDLTDALQHVDAGLTNVAVPMSEGIAESLPLNDLTLVRGSTPVALTACGAGLQRIAVLETLYHIDVKAVPQGSGVKKGPIIWLIEEPETCLYESLVDHVGKRMREIAQTRGFTVCITTHSRQMAISTLGGVGWVHLDPARGSKIDRHFDLADEAQHAAFHSHCQAAFGLSWLERTLGEGKGEDRVLVVEGKHDRLIVSKLLQMSGTGTTQAIQVTEPFGKGGEAAVKETVWRMAELAPLTLVVGLFDNDYVGCEAHRALHETIRQKRLRNASALLLPETEGTKRAPRGELVAGATRVRTRDAHESVNLAGCSLTIEALYDAPALEEALVKRGHFLRHWVAQTRDGKMRFVRWPSEGSKTDAANVVAELLDPADLGSLKGLRDLITTTFAELAKQSRAGARPTPRPRGGRARKPAA